MTQQSRADKIQELGELYDFFIRKEQRKLPFAENELLTTYHHSLETVRKHIKTTWSWFLTQDEGRVLRCSGLRGYPKQYFIDGHDPKYAKHLLPFATLIVKTHKPARPESQPTTQPEGLEPAKEKLYSDTPITATEITASSRENASGSTASGDRASDGTSFQQEKDVSDSSLPVPGSLPSPDPQLTPLALLVLMWMWILHLVRQKKAPSTSS